MSFQEDYKKENDRGRQPQSPERQAYRKKRALRTRLILINSGLALIVIMTVLVGKLISLNRSNPHILQAEDKQNAVSSEKKEEKNKDSGKTDGGKENAGQTEAPEKTTEPEVTESPKESVGAKQWIRTDLNPDKPMVALTFDDGPYAPVTKKILETLEKNDAKATFFLVANRISNYPDVVKQAYEQGCQIASHTYEHKFLSTLKKRQIKAQIEKADQAIEKVIGCPSTALRPPGGLVNDKVRSTVKVPMICWNVDSEDWKSRNTKKVLKKCRSIKDGDIVLMHDLYPTTAKAVVTLVPRLKKQGFQLVTVDELLYYKGIKAEAGKVYFSGK